MFVLLAAGPRLQLRRPGPPLLAPLPLRAALRRRFRDPILQTIFWLEKRARDKVEFQWHCFDDRTRSLFGGCETTDE